LQQQQQQQQQQEVAVNTSTAGGGDNSGVRVIHINTESVEPRAESQGADTDN
jgi:hypothetical protein